MTKNSFNAENERLKRRYFSYLTEAKGKNEKTVDKVAAALAAFEQSTKWRSFKKFHIEQAKSFKRRLAEQTNQRTGRPLSKGTISAVLIHVRAFFIWLAEQPGYRSKITYSDADYFSPATKDRRQSRAHNIAKGPTLQQVGTVLQNMPDEAAVEKRDRALIAFTLLTGSRVGATATLRLKHVDLAEGSVFMDAREVNTKNSKTFTTVFFPVGEEIRRIFEEWVDYLLHVRFFGPEDPLFPRTLVRQGKSRRFEVVDFERKPWRTVKPIQDIFEKAFTAAGLPYYNPHSFRNTLVRYGYEVCGGDMKALKVWSQNFSHESMLTTYLGYGAVAPAEHATVMRELGTRHASTKQSNDQDELKALLKRNIEVQEALRSEPRGSANSVAIDRCPKSNFDR